MGFLRDFPVKPDGILTKDEKSNILVNLSPNGLELILDWDYPCPRDRKPMPTELN